jgi:hypothetical protein
MDRAGYGLSPMAIGPGRGRRGPEGWPEWSISPSKILTALELRIIAAPGAWCSTHLACEGMSGGGPWQVLRHVETLPRAVCSCPAHASSYLS